MRDLARRCLVALDAIDGEWKVERLLDMPDALMLAIAAPTPLDAPVTRTVLPLISMRVLPGSFPLRPNGSPPKAARTLLQRSPCAPKGQRVEIEATISFVVTTALA